MIDPEILLAGTTDDQRGAITSASRQLLVVAGAGSGKTDVMARRVAWWIFTDGVPKDGIVAFTFTEKAAEELTFRIRKYVSLLTPANEDATLGGMYVGTLHGYCLKLLREADPDAYHNYDVLDEEGRPALVQRAYDRILGLRGFQTASGVGYYAAIELFLRGYDYLNEYDELQVRLPSDRPPYRIEDETEWCRQAELETNVGSSDLAMAFARSAARYYAYLRCRRFLDFSTSQSEVLRLFRNKPALLPSLRSRLTRIVVDEAQDLNPVQHRIVDVLVGESGWLTAVGDHRQAIYGWRGGRVDLMGDLYERISSAADGEVVELTANFRSTPRILDVANSWARTIGPVGSMTSPDMDHGRSARTDLETTHVAALTFETRTDEAAWIAESIRQLVPERGRGAVNDKEDGWRGITYADIAVLLRSSTDARTYMQQLERHGIPAVFKAGPDLFAQPEILLFAAALANAAGVSAFFGRPDNPRTIAGRIQQVLGVAPQPVEVIRAAVALLIREGIPILEDADRHLIDVTSLIRRRTAGDLLSSADVTSVKTRELREWLTGKGQLRRLFPQRIYHLILSEAEVGDWESSGERGVSALFHLGQLSSLVTAIETPGWTTASDFQFQMIALTWWGASQARMDETPLLVQPDAVTVGTIHGAKGLEFGAVFLADVCTRRFPSQFARRQPRLPYDGPILARISPARLADNANMDQERRLMYVALTRAERYLFATTSLPSPFFRDVSDAVVAAGGYRGAGDDTAPGQLTHAVAEFRRDVRLVTSFSDMRYYLECPHDFYLRKVLGFAPTIDQAFGYGRGVHNLMRHIHSDPSKWAALAQDRDGLVAAIDGLMDGGLFYLRYTTGDPARNMRAKAVRIVADYVQTYADELGSLTFEPEREFETLLPEQEVLISGAIDVIRLDDPPRVTLIDFKSGDPESDISSKLDSDEMRLQVSLYGLAAKRELEYEPDRGLVRYLGAADSEESELSVPLDDESLAAARTVAVGIASNIRDRRFASGPTRPPRDARHHTRCGECDFKLFCGRPEAAAYRRGN